LASSSRLTPGETGKVTVSVDVRGKRGKLTKTAQVYTNDPQKPVTTLLMHLDVKDHLHADVPLKR